MKPGNPIHEVWQARDELLAEHGGNFDAYFNWLMREQEKSGVRIVRPAPSGTEHEPTTVLREEPPPCGQKPTSQK